MIKDKVTVVVHGISTIDEIPELKMSPGGTTIRCSSDLETLRDALPGAEALLAWEFQARALKEAWDCADQLKWVQWGGTGVDAALFPEFSDSDVVLTNMGGIFDGAMAEYVL